MGVKSKRKTGSNHSLRGAYYESARDELIERIKLRDYCLIAYIASAGAYFSFIVKDNVKMSGEFHVLLMDVGIVIVLPIISLVFTFIILQHHMMIGKIGKFLRRNYKRPPIHWEMDYASWVDKRYLSARTFSQGLLLLIPLGYTLAFALNAFHRVGQDCDSRALVVAVVAIDSIILVGIVWLHIWAYEVRKDTDRVEETPAKLR
jgi:hypothetical protein